MQKLLLERGILPSSGDISKDKINLISGAITEPFAEMVWATTGGDMDVINRLTDVIVSMNIPTDRDKLFKILRMLYGLLGLQFPDEAVLLANHKEALDYFLFSFLLDFGDIIKDYVAENATATMD